MLKKLTATGILAGAATGVILLGGPAHADRLAAYPAECYYTTPGVVPPAWCANYVPPAYYQPTYYPPPTYYYPGYNNGWNRWHHGWGGYPYHFHR